MSTPPGAALKTPPKDIRDQMVVQRSNKLRSLCVVIPESSFKMRRDFFITGTSYVTACCTSAVARRSIP